MTVSGVWLFLAVPWVSLQRFFVIFPDHTHFFNFSYIGSDELNEAIDVRLLKLAWNCPFVRYVYLICDVC